MIYLLIAVAVIGFIAVFCYVNNNYLLTTHYNLDIDCKSEFRIVQLSDLHSKEFGKKNCVLYKRIEKLKPDFICYTGDLIDDDGRNIENTVEFMGNLLNIAPVYYIYGNHELRTGKEDYIGNSLKEKGIIVLKNEQISFDLKGQTINILGLYENQASKKNYKERKRGEFVFKDNSHFFTDFVNKSGVKIVMSHYPENFDSDYGYRYKNYDFDIQLSGHAHGGQFRFPIFGGVFSPGQGIHPRFYQGVHGNKPFLVISRGLGNSGFPLRLFNLPEILCIDVK